MKKNCFILILMLVSGIVSGQNLRAYLNYATFNTPDNKPYIETYFTIDGSSTSYHQVEGNVWQNQVNIQVLFFRNDSIVDFAKYSLMGSKVTDSSAFTDLLDVQRYALPTGLYRLSIRLSDQYAPQDTISTVVEVELDYPANQMVFSDIELISSYEKGGEGLLVKNDYTLVPYVFNYYPESSNVLTFYNELYHSQLQLGDQPFMLYYYIRPFEVDKRLDQYFKMKKADPAPVRVTLSSFDIKNLPSGNYLLVMEARDRNNELLAQKELFFQRSNPSSEFNLSSLLSLNTENTFVGSIANRDTLVQYIKYLTPISTDIERRFIAKQLNTANTTTLQKYFLNFWYERDRVNPEKAWADYLVLVKQANHNFSSVALQGFETDRGRVYLQYGQPNVISQNYNEPAAYPYEIWHYYQLGDQRDKKFVFYSHDNVTNDFQLIHSNAIGELSNYRWQNVIYRRTWDPYSIDDGLIPDTYGSGATQNYIQPGSR